MEKSKSYLKEEREYFVVFKLDDPFVSGKGVSFHFVKASLAKKAGTRFYGWWKKRIKRFFEINKKKGFDYQVKIHVYKDANDYHKGKEPLFKKELGYK